MAMDDIKEKKAKIRQEVLKRLSAMSERERLEKYRNVKDQLFEFSNFLESILFMHLSSRIDSY